MLSVELGSDDDPSLLCSTVATGSTAVEPRLRKESSADAECHKSVDEAAEPVLIDAAMAVGPELPMVVHEARRVVLLSVPHTVLPLLELLLSSLLLRELEGGGALLMG